MREGSRIQEVIKTRRGGSLFNVIVSEMQHSLK